MSGGRTRSWSRRRKLRERRPAETGAGLAGLLVAAAAALGVDVDPTALVALATAIGFLPAIITAIVERVRR